MSYEHCERHDLPATNGCSECLKEEQARCAHRWKCILCDAMMNPSRSNGVTTRELADAMERAAHDLSGFGASRVLVSKGALLHWARELRRMNPAER